MLAGANLIKEKISNSDKLSHAVSAFDNLAQRYNSTDANTVSLLTLDPDHPEVLPVHFLNEAVEVDFEFLKIPIMAHCVEAIEIHYGKNWREHVIGTSMHGAMLIDTDRPYTDYIQK